MLKYALSSCLALVAPSLAAIVSYEGNSFPEDVGWERRETLFTADRWTQGGWFFQSADIVGPGPPEVPEEDIYDYSLAEFAGTEMLFVEWRMQTDGPREGIPAVAPAALVAGGRMGIWYHFTIAEDQVLFVRDPYVPAVWVDIEPDVPHTYRVELYVEELYLWYIDGELVDSGVPEGPYPTSDSVIVFGARAAGGTITAQWDYIRFGVQPADGSGDYDSDEDVDNRDFYFFHECLTNARLGINGGPDDDAGPGCRFADFDADGDVDLRDLAAFQNAFTGGE